MEIESLVIDRYPGFITAEQSLAFCSLFPRVYEPFHIRRNEKKWTAGLCERGLQLAIFTCTYISNNSFYLFSASASQILTSDAKIQDMLCQTASRSLLNRESFPFPSSRYSPTAHSALPLHYRPCPYHTHWVPASGRSCSRRYIPRSPAP